MPVTVKLALIAPVVAMVVGVFDYMLQGSLTRQESPGDPLPGILLSLLINLTLLAFIAARHNWARWVYSVLTVIGLPLVIPAMLMEARPDPIGAASTALQFLLILASVILLFKEPSRQWFGGEFARIQAS